MASSMIGFEHLQIQLEDIKSATNNFSEENVIGHGGFGKVYKGVLSHSHSEGKSMVALKRLDRRHGQGDSEFYKEVRMLSCYRNENIISLLGFSSGLDEMILVYEYASRGSLDRYLKDVTFTWAQRIKVCLDAAKGLCYLHDPRETYQRLIHCDIKSANILLDENFKAKVSDFGLSKIGPANQQNSILVTGALGTLGYCDPLFMETYSLTKESDVYSFGVVLFEVLCGKLCFEFSNGQLKILVPMWKQSYEQKQLSGIVFQGMAEQMNPDSLDTFADIAFKCLKRFREERPAMSLVVEKLEAALALQELHDLKPPKEYEEIVDAAVPPLNYKSLDELKVLLTEGFHIYDGKTWFSVSEKGEHYGLISIQECFIQDDPITGYSDRYSTEKKSRFKVGCFKTRLMEFKLRVRTPLFLSPDVTYGLNLVFHCNETEKIKQQHVGLRYQLQGATKFSILRFADKREDKTLVAELYQFTSNEDGIQDLEILLEDCGLTGDFYIEGIEFQPLKNEKLSVVVANEEIVRAVESPMFYRLTEESKVLLSQGVLLNGGKMWLSLNRKEERYVIVSIQDYLVQENPKRDYSAQYSFEKSSRFTVGCYRTIETSFKIRVSPPILLSPNVEYGLNLVFQYEEREQINQQYVSVRYTLQGEKKISFVYFADRRKDGWLVAELYQFTSDSDKIISDLEITFECCQFSGILYIEGIEFQPLKRVEHPAVEYEDILKVAVPHVFYRSAEELKVLLFRGILLKGGKMWFSINDKEEHCLMLSIEDCLIREDPNKDYSNEYSLKKISRFAVGCYETDRMNFKIRVKTPLFLSQQVTYGLNLVFHYTKKEQTKQLFLPVRYKLQGETKITIVPFANKREDEQLVARLYNFTNDSDKRIGDLEILFENSDYSGYFHIEGIEFQPLLIVEHPLEEYEMILEDEVPRVFYTSAEELKVLFFRGILLNGGKMWFSINDKEEHCLMLSIEDCLIRDDSNKDYSDEYLLKEDSRFVSGCYKAHTMAFRIRVITPLFLSSHVTYRVNLIFQYSNIEQMKQQSFPAMYKLLGETKISLVNVAYMREDGWLVAELYHFTNEGDTSILDHEIIFEDCGLSGYFYIEGIEFQPLGRVEHPVVVVVEYEEILKAAATPLFYRSVEELKLLLTRGILLNGGKTLFCLNDKGQHIQRVFIEACLNPDEAGKVKHWDACVDSRFPGGLCYDYTNEFKACVRGQYLTPQLSYTVNLVFRYRWEHEVNSHNPLRYKIDGDNKTKVLIIYPTIHKREDGWFVVPLYQFISQHTTADLQFEFEYRYANLLVAGIEFQPSEEKVELQVFENYQDILEVASQSLFYTSVDELKQILYKGILMKDYKTWFSLNEKGEHCHLISMKDCLIPNQDFTPQYKSNHRSRFPVGFYQTNNKGFKTHVKTQLLSPSITYTVNLLFSSSGDRYGYVDLKYRLSGEQTSSVVYRGNERDRNLYMAELYQFISDGSIVDLEIDFYDHGTNIDGVEGILFQPLEIVEDKVSKDDKVGNIQAISDSESDTYWEKKSPNDYNEILNLSKDSLIWTTKKELYSILRRGFLINNGLEWFTVDKHGKKCLMLSARATCVIDDKNWACKSLLETRFGEVLVITTGYKFEINIEFTEVSPKTTYAAYLVYKSPKDQSTFEAPICVWRERVYSYPDSYIYLVSPPHTPVIGSKFDETSYNPLNRYKENAIPQQRIYGWMEVRVWEFQNTTKTVPMHLYFEHRDKKNLKGLMVQGIELRPI